MYNFFCKPLRYSFVIMRTLQKKTQTFWLRQNTFMPTHNNLHTFYVI